jgi:hypothetical protein
MRVHYRLGTPILFLATLGILSATATQGRADIQDGLVVHLTFDQADGNGNPQDTSRRSNHGTIVRPGPDSPYIPGIIGMAFQTAGRITAPEYPTGNYITLGMPADLDFGASTDFSFSWWGMYTNTAQHDDIPWLSNKDWNSSSTRGYVLASEPGGKITWDFRSRGDPKSFPGGVGTLQQGTLDDGQWHHYAVVFVRGLPGSGTIYLDGIQTFSAPITSTGEINIGLPLNIFQDGTGTYTDQGAAPDGANWDTAAMDDLGIWRRAITADEVNLIYTMGLQGVSAFDPIP